MKKGKTKRGFAIGEFVDLYGAKCSIQKSSSAEYDAIWLGVDDAEPKVMCRDARKVGVKTDATCGWVDYPIPDEVLLTTRMHLTREQVKEDLLPVLTRFVETGEI